MNRFVLKSTFIKNIYISLFNKYFYKNKLSKLCYGDRVAVHLFPIWGEYYITLSTSSHLYDVPLLQSFNDFSVYRIL